MTRDDGTNLGLTATGLGIATGALLYSAPQSALRPPVQPLRQALPPPESLQAVRPESESFRIY